MLLFLVKLKKERSVAILIQRGALSQGIVIISNMEGE